MQRFSCAQQHTSRNSKLQFCLASQISPALPVPDSPIAWTCIEHLGDQAGSNPLAADGVGLAIKSCTVSLRWGQNFRDHRSRVTGGTEEHCTQAHSHKNPRVTPAARELWYFRRVQNYNLCGRRGRDFSGPIQQAHSCEQPSCDLSQGVLYLPPSARGITRKGPKKDLRGLRSRGRGGSSGLRRAPC